MKTPIVIFLMLFSYSIYGQNIITDTNFKEKIGNNTLDQTSRIATPLSNNIVVVEFWASFNSHNQFNNYNKLKGATFYRCDVSKSPSAIKDYGIKTIPHIIVFVNGVDKYHIKAGVDFSLCKPLNKVQIIINKYK